MIECEDAEKWKDMTLEVSEITMRHRGCAEGSCTEQDSCCGFGADADDATHAARALPAVDRMPTAHAAFIFCASPATHDTSLGM